MSIGENLAEARRRAGLSVTQVSQQTCIRETIIREIEHDQYAACGGDFYARGHIRSIARAVGTEPEPLIQEYDATRRAPSPARAADLLGPVTPIEFRRRRRLWPGMTALVLAVAAGAAAYYLLAAPRQPPRAAGHGAARAAAVSGHHAAAGVPSAPPSTPAAGPSSPPPPQPYAHLVAVRLTAAEDCWVQFTTPAGGYLFQFYVNAGSVKTWTFRYPVDMQLGNPGGVQLTVDGKHPLPPGTVNPITLHLGLGGRVSG